MDFSKTLLRLIVSLSCLLFHTNAVPLSESLQAQVMKLCKNTTNPTFCVQTILPQIRGGIFNPYKALEAEILATQNQVRKTSDVIDGLLANPGNYSKDLRDSLTICKEEYGNMLDSINETIEEVARRDVIEARFKFSAVLSFYATCDDEFTTGPSPFANDANVVYQLGGNCLDIMKAIEDGERVPNTPPAPLYSTPPGPCQHVIGICP